MVLPRHELYNPRVRRKYELAERLGYANPDAMLSEMAAHHVVQWEQFLAVKQWEAERARKKQAKG